MTSNIVRVALGPLDFKAIQERVPNIATLPSNTYLRIRENSLRDLSNLGIAAETYGFQVNQLIPDTEPPVLLEFILSKGLEE